MNASQAAVAALPTDLKLNNRMQILEIFKGGGEYTANHIADKIGVSRQTVMKAIQFFVEKGLIISTGKADSTNVGGKRPELFSLTGQKYLLSISLWPDIFQMTLLNFKFETIETFKVTDTIPLEIGAAVKMVGEAASGLLKRNHIQTELLCCVNISTSGIIDYENNILKYNSLIPEWGSNISLARYLRPYFTETTPILLENVAKVIGRSVLNNQSFQGKRTMTLFSSWGGICASLIENGAILNGRNSLIGEIGHMLLEPDDAELCGCGCRGCFERLVSNERLRLTVGKELADYPDSLLCPVPLDTMTIADIFAASAKDDAYARKLVSRIARYFATTLHNITLVFDPEIVVFHGDYALADDWFCQELRRCLNEFQYTPADGPFELHLNRQPIQQLNTQGAYILMLDYLFGDASLYE